MKNLRVEFTDDGTALYVAVDPKREWARTTQPDDLVTIDWDEKGEVVGIEVIGSVARDAIRVFLMSIEHGTEERGRRDMRLALDSLREDS